MIPYIAIIATLLAIGVAYYFLCRRSKTRNNHHVTSSSSSSNNNDADLAAALAPPLDAPPYEFKADPIPYDYEGYVQSFRVDQKQEYERFFRRYGVVVVRDVLTSEEAKATADEAWSFIKEYFNEGVDQHDPSTWSVWPGMQQFGLLGNRRTTTPQVDFIAFAVVIFHLFHNRLWYDMRV
jgi:hypothetical protein